MNTEIIKTKIKSVMYIKRKQGYTHLHK